MCPRDNDESLGRRQRADANGRSLDEAGGVRARHRPRSLGPSVAVAALLAVALLIGPQPATAARGFHPPTGSYWFGERLPGTEATAQALVLRADSAVMPGLCRVGSVQYVEDRTTIAVRATFRSCGAWQGRSAVVTGEIDKATDSVLQGVLVVDGLFDVPVVATLGYGESLRVLTYNVQMLPSHFSAATKPANATKISARVKAGGYDVVALNEVFDEDVREKFLEHLEASFPYHVDYLSGGTAVNEDAGLMLFSRLPFRPLPDDTYRADNQSCEATNCGRVGFLEFGSCEGDDCLAEKGVGFVRLRNPETASPVNVAFTHMQASYTPADYPDELEDAQDAAFEFSTRIEQQVDIKELLQTTLGQSRLHSEPVIVMGDLNIDGDLANPDLGGWPNFNVRNLYEWNQAMTDVGNPNFSFLPLRDGWAYDNAPVWSTGNFDRGITNISAWGANADGARLDYVLLNEGESRRCMQHMTLAHNLRHGGALTETGFGPTGVGMGGKTDLSDHYGLNADINLESDRCRPVNAQLLTPAEGQLKTATGTIGRPGEIDWFKINRAGTYSFDLDGPAGMDYRVYESANMSTPAPNYKHETTDVTVGEPRPVHFTGEQFRISKAPFFIRVWHTDRSKTGSFTLKVLRHDCGTKELACALAPAERRNVALPASPPLNGADERWYEFYTEAVPGGGAQSVRAIASELDPAAAGYFELELLKAGDPDTSVGVDGSQEPDPAPETPGTEVLSVQQDEGGAQKYYLVVRRIPASPPPYPPAARSFQVRWETNLTFVFGAGQGGAQSLQVRCLEENDGLDLDGDDEVYLEAVRADGSDLLGGKKFLGNFDAGNPRDLEAHVPTPVAFLSGLEFEGYENDDFAAGEIDEMGATIPPLALGTQGPVTTSIDFSPEGDGNYRIYYNVTHGFDD